MTLDGGRDLLVYSQEQQMPTRIDRREGLRTLGAGLVAAYAHHGGRRDRSDQYR